MFKFLYKLNSIEHFQVKYGFEVIKIKNGEYVFNSEIVQGYKYVSLQPNNLICKKTDDYYFIENVISGKITKLDTSKSYSIGGDFFEHGAFYDINITFDEQVIDFRKDFYYHNFQTNEEKLLIIQGIGYFFTIYDKNTKSIFRSNNKLSSLSLLTGEYGWEIDLSVYCQYTDWEGKTIQGILGILGVYEGKLWLLCAYRRMLGLSLETGEVQIDILLGDLRPELKDLIVSPAPIYDEAHQEFVFCTYKYYFRLNVRTSQLSIFQIVPLPHKADTIQTQIVSGDFVYYTGTGQIDENTYQTMVGVYNPMNNCIEWQYGLGGVIVNQPPQVAENKLYVLDSGGTLHIFEKE